MGVIVRDGPSPVVRHTGARPGIGSRPRRGNGHGDVSELRGRGALRRAWATRTKTGAPGRRPSWPRSITVCSTRVGLLVSIPFIASKYTGPPSYFVGPFLTFPGPLDDGTYHAAFQDLRVELRRQWWAGAVPVTPFVGFSFPTHDYETVGEAVPGRHRWDLQAGVSSGVDLDRMLPGSYVHVRYAYGRMQEVDNHPFTRSNIDLDVGVAATSRFLVRGLADWQIRHTGPTLAATGSRLGEPRSLHRAELSESGRRSIGVGDAIDGCLRVAGRCRRRQQRRAPSANACRLASTSLCTPGCRGSAERTSPRRPQVPSASRIMEQFR